MPNGVDAARLARLRDLAVSALKQTKLFGNASWRLLSDFVDVIGTVKPVEGILNLKKLELLVVLDGRVQVSQGPGAPVVLLDPGLYLSSPGAVFHGPVDVNVQQYPTGSAAVFSISEPHWKEIRKSFDLARSLVLNELPADMQVRMAGVKDPSKFEVVWLVLSEQIAQVSAEPGRIASLLLHFLAAGVSRVVQQDLIWAVEMLGGSNYRLQIWRGGGLEGEPSRSDNLVASLAAAKTSGGLPQRLFICWSQPGDRPPPPAPGKQILPFDRAIYLHDGESAQFPAERVFAEVPAAYTHGDPEPSVLERGVYASRLSVSLRERRRHATPDELPQNEPPESVGAGVGRALFRAYTSAVGLIERRRHFQARPLLDAAGAPSGKSTRVERDGVRLDLGVPKLLERWREFKAAGGIDERFAESLFDRDDSFLYQAKQLGRAVAGKRVGIAVSGGGASAFRIGPLLAQIGSEPEKVDVDFFAGVSGGALVGAYYCALGTSGISQLIAEAERLQWVLPLLSVSTWPLEAWIDAHLGGLRVEDLSTPVFLPVTTELAGEDPPRAVVIASGTLGEAVRASGSLPLGFGPTQKDGKRYADGAAAGLIPKAMLDDRADVILGCDAVPGPRHSNPWYDVLPVVLAHDFTPVGRVIDVWTWTAFMFQNASRAASYGADVFLNFEPDKIPMLDTIGWGRATEIVADARNDKRILKAAQDLYQAYLKAGGP